MDSMAVSGIGKIFAGHDGREMIQICDTEIIALSNCNETTIISHDKNILN